MTAHINVLVRALIYISALVLVDSRTFKYCFNITRPGNNLDTMTIDNFTMYTVYCNSSNTVQSILCLLFQSSTVRLAKINNQMFL